MDMAETNRGFFIHLQDKKAVVTEQEIPMPVVSPDDVLVAVSGASVNPVDLKRAASGDQQVMGFDTVGRVVRTGANVSGFSAGQKVFFAGEGQRQGSFARYQSVTSKLVVATPRGFESTFLASLPLTGITAWELLFEKMGYTASAGANHGQVLLVINGAGGVGSILTQLAKWSGLTVVATASPKNFDWLTANGVDHALDYHQDLTTAYQALNLAAPTGVAILYQPVPYAQVAADLVAYFGHVGSIVEPSGPLALAPLKNKSASFDFEYMSAKTDAGVNVASQGAILQQLADLLQSGAIRPTATRTFPVLTTETLTEGLHTLQAGHAVGKLTFHVGNLQ